MGSEIQDKPEVSVTKEIIENAHLTPETLIALETLASSEVPEYAIQRRPGKGGKVFDYVSHVWVTRLLRDAFNMMWGMEVITYEVFDDSAVAIVRLYVDLPTAEERFYRTEITEVGIFDGGGGKMSKAAMVASAVSRGLCRCVMRKFGVGQEFYEDTSAPDLAQAWVAAIKQADRMGLTEEELVHTLEANGITRENLADEYLKVWQIIDYAARVKRAREVNFGASDDQDVEGTT